MEEKKAFTTYEYISIPVKPSMESLYGNCYQSFGWQVEGMSATLKTNVSELKLKRDRRIKNREEIRELQKQLEINLLRLEKLERLKNLSGTVLALSIGFIGTALLTGGVFAYLAGKILLCVILAIPGFTGWILPIFIYSRLTAKKENQLLEIRERLYDSIYEVCERAGALIYDNSHDAERQDGQ